MACLALCSRVRKRKEVNTPSKGHEPEQRRFSCMPNKYTWSECERVTSVENGDAQGRPHPPVFSFGNRAMKPFPGILRSRWLACPVSILALFGLTWFVWPKPAGSGLTVQFAGLVGGWSPARFAIFSVSNMTSRSISFVTGNPQLGTGGVWSQGIVWPTRPVVPSYGSDSSPIIS
jgi:hypothetical protein